MRKSTPSRVAIVAVMELKCHRRSGRAARHPEFFGAPLQQAYLLAGTGPPVGGFFVYPPKKPYQVRRSETVSERRGLLPAVRTAGENRRLAVLLTTMPAVTGHRRLRQVSQLATAAPAIAPMPRASTAGPTP